MKLNKIYLGDCLELMPKHVEDKSIDMIFCDLPYGTTACKWDTIIQFDRLWSEYERIIKDNGVIVLFGNEPFSSVLRTSNIKLYKYDWTWNKVGISNPMMAKKQPLRCVENIMVFYKKAPTYNPIMTKGKQWHRGGKKEHKTDSLGQSTLFNNGSDKTDLKYPKNLIEFSNANKMNNVHPTQKPLALIEYMIKTYTNEGDLILDNTCGSGTTGLGAKNLNRDYIMMEQDPKYYEIACKRVQD